MLLGRGHWALLIYGTPVNLTKSIAWRKRGSRDYTVTTSWHPSSSGLRNEGGGGGGGEGMLYLYFYNCSIIKQIYLYSIVLTDLHSIQEYL